MTTLRGQASTASLINFLWGALDKDSATDADLCWLHDLTCAVDLMATNLGETLAGIGGLVSSERDNSASIRSGAFEGSDLCGLLWSAADTLQTISQLSFIAGEAGYHLNEHLTARAKTSTQVANAAPSRRGRKAKDSSTEAQ